MLAGKLPSLVVFILLCYGVAFSASAITRPQIRTWYTAIRKPSWAPPNWMFPVVWTILYGLMAVAGWRVWNSPAGATRNLALLFFGFQLFLNFLWSPVFFNLHRIGLGVLIIAALWLAILSFVFINWNFHRTASWLFLPYLAWVTLAAALNFTIWRLNPSAGNDARSRHIVLGSPPASPRNVAAAYELSVQEVTEFPSEQAWSAAVPVTFAADWQGKNPDPALETEVRVAWTHETLFLRFKARYRVINVFREADNSGRRDQLWDRDVAEAFLQPDPSDPLTYKEFEVSPNGFWIDLNISHGQKSDLGSNLRRHVVLDEHNKIWIAQLAIPMTVLVNVFDPAKKWRANFFRVEGLSEPRFYSAWQPTKTESPNFHVPEAFGVLEFALRSKRTNKSNES